MDEGKKLVAAEMWFFGMILKIPSTKRGSNKDVLMKMATVRRLLVKIRKRQLKLLGPNNKEGGLKKP